MTNQTFHPQPWLALLVVGLIAWGAAGLRAEGTPPPEYLLQARELVRSFAAAQDGLAWLEQHRSQLTAENVANVDEVTRVALQIGNLNLASAAAQLVSLAKLDAGDRRGALAAQVRKLEIELRLASTTQAYQEVRVAARGTASMAASINAADLESRLLTIAAEAGYFADQPMGTLP